jgi:large subunit ribosomal protein L23
MKTSAQVISSPVISEKAFGLAETGQYVFLVPTSATKLQVRSSVEKEFKVNVTKVNSILVKGRPRRYGKITGRTKDYKKMIVTLKEGEKIQMFEGETKGETKGEKK